MASVPVDPRLFKEELQKKLISQEPAQNLVEKMRGPAGVPVASPPPKSNPVKKPVPKRPVQKAALPPAVESLLGGPEREFEDLLNGLNPGRVNRPIDRDAVAKEFLDNAPAKLDARIGAKWRAGNLKGDVYRFLHAKAERGGVTDADIEAAADAVLRGDPRKLRLVSKERQAQKFDQDPGRAAGLPFSVADYHRARQDGSGVPIASGGAILLKDADEFIRSRMGMEPDAFVQREAGLTNQAIRAGRKDRLRSEMDQAAVQPDSPWQDYLQAMFPGLAPLGGEDADKSMLQVAGEGIFGLLNLPGQGISEIANRGAGGAANIEGERWGVDPQEILADPDMQGALRQGELQGNLAFMAATLPFLFKIPQLANAMSALNVAAPIMTKLGSVFSGERSKEEAAKEIELWVDQFRPSEKKGLMENSLVALNWLGAAADVRGSVIGARGMFKGGGSVVPEVPKSDPPALIEREPSNTGQVQNVPEMGPGSNGHQITPQAASWLDQIVQQVQQGDEVGAAKVQGLETTPATADNLPAQDVVNPEAGRKWIAVRFSDDVPDELKWDFDLVDRRHGTYVINGEFEPLVTRLETELPGKIERLGDESDRYTEFMNGPQHALPGETSDSPWPWQFGARGNTAFGDWDRHKLRLQLDVEARRRNQREQAEAKVDAHQKREAEIRAQHPAENEVNPYPASRGIVPGKAMGQVKSGDVVTIAPEDVSVHPNMQHRRNANARGLTDDNRLDGQTFLKDQQGPMTVFVDHDGKVFIGDGHHRLDLALRAERFGIRDVNGTVTETPRGIDVIVRNAKDGWTVEDVAAEAAMRNMAAGTVDAIDAVSALHHYGRSVQDVIKDGVALKPKAARDIDGLLHLPADHFETYVRRGTVVPEVAAGIGSVEGLSAAEVETALRSVEKIEGRAATYDLGVQIARDVKQVGVRSSQETILFGDEWAEAKPLPFPERAQIIGSLKSRIGRMVGDLLRPVDTKLLEGERIDVGTRKGLVEGLGGSSRQAKGRLDFALEYDKALSDQIWRLAEDVQDGKITPEEAAKSIEQRASKSAQRSLNDIIQNRAEGELGSSDARSTQVPGDAPEGTVPPDDGVDGPGLFQMAPVGLVGAGLEEDDEDTKRNMVLSGLALLAAIGGRRAMSKTAWGKAMRGRFGKAIEPFLEEGWGMRHLTAQALLDPRLYGKAVGGRAEWAVNRLLQAKGDWHVRTERDQVAIKDAAAKAYGKGWQKDKAVRKSMAELRDKLETDGPLTEQEKVFVDEIQKIHAKFGPWAWKLGIGIDDVNTGDKSFLVGGEVRAMADVDGTKMRVTGEVTGIDVDGTIRFETELGEFEIAPGAKFDRPIHELGTKFVPRILKPEFVAELKKMTEARTAAAMKLVDIGQAKTLADAYEAVDDMAKARSIESGGRPVYFEYVHQFDKIAQDILDRNPTEFSTLADARAWLQEAGEHLGNEKDLISFMSSLEKARRVDLAGEHYLSDYMEAFGRYVDRAHKRIALAEAMGNPDPRALDLLLKGVKQADPKHGDYIEKMLVRLFRLGDAKGADRDEFRRIAAAEGSLQSILKLTGGTTQVAQLTDLVQVLTRVETSSALKGIRDMFSKDKVLDNMILSGGHRDIIADILPEDSRGKLQKTADFVHTVTLIKGLDRGVKTLSMAIGLQDVRTLLKRGKLSPADARRAERYGLMADDLAKGESILDDEKTLNRIAERIRGDLSYSGASEHNPLWMSNPAGAAFMRLKKPVYYVSKFLIRDVMAEATHGNFKPMVKLLGYGGVVGAGVQEFKAWLDQKEPDWEEEVDKDTPLSRRITLGLADGLDRMGQAGALGLAKDLTKPYNFDITGKFDVLSAAAPVSASDLRNWLGTMSEFEWTDPFREILGLKEARGADSEDVMRDLGRTVPLVRRVKNRVAPEE